MSKLLTFRQFPFASGSWLWLLTPDGGPSTADPTDDRHGVIVSSNLQGVPVWDEGQPAVLSLQGHLKRHESLQVHVTVEVRMSHSQKLFRVHQLHAHINMYGNHCPSLVPQTYTVLLSCRISLLENSLRISKKARLRGGLPSPWGLGSLKANSIPFLNKIQEKQWMEGLAH